MIILLTLSGLHSLFIIMLFANESKEFLFSTNIFTSRFVVKMRRLKKSIFEISGTRENSAAITRCARCTVCREDCEGVSGIGVGYRAARVAREIKKTK